VLAGVTICIPRELLVRRHILRLGARHAPSAN
jgi:hypothetical protein